MTPPTKEAYYYRMIYEQHYPSMAAVCTVPQAKSIACSTEKAIEWDEQFKKNTDESGRAVLGVHVTTGTDHAMDLTKSENNNEIKSEMTLKNDKNTDVKVILDSKFNPV